MKSFPRRAFLVAFAMACVALPIAWRRHAGLWPFAPGPGTRGPAWRAGHAYSYAVTWRGASVARSPLAAQDDAAKAFDGNLDLEATLRVEALAPDGRTYPVRVALESVARASMRVLGQDLLLDEKFRASVLAPRTLEADMDAAGHLVRMRLPNDTPELTAELVEGILLELQVTREAGESYVVEERTPDGVFAIRYTRDAGDRRLRRTRTKAVTLAGLQVPCDDTCRTELEGSATLGFDGRDDLSEVSDDVRTRVRDGSRDALLESSLRFHAELRDVRDSAAPAPLVASVGYGVKQAGDPWESLETARKVLEKRAAGITIEDVLSGLGLAGSLGPEHLPDGWIVRATAFFELHPELLNELAARFDDPAAGRQARVTILDLLAATGSGPAQKVLRELLTGATAGDDANRLTLIQRLALLQKPAPETVHFLRERFEGSRVKGDLHMALASAHALGSLAGKDSETNREEARAAVASLRQALEQTKSPEEKAGLIHALGNVGDGNLVATIVKSAGDEDEDVRMAVAAALRKTPSAEAQTALLSLAADASPGVERAALTSLAEQPMSDQVRVELGRLVEGGALVADSEPQAVTVLLRGGPLTPEVEQALRALLARTEDKRLQARLRLLLAQKGVPG